MIAARIARTAAGIRPQQRLLSPGIGGTDAHRLLDNARACNITVLNRNRPLQDPGPWHARARCWFVADPLHGPHTTIDRTRQDRR